MNSWAACEVPAPVRKPAYHRYRIASLGDLGGGRSFGLALSAAGEVVGWSYLADGERYHAFRHALAMQDLGTLGGDVSVALGINRAGQVVGWAETDEGVVTAFRFAGGEMHRLPAEAGACSVASAINDRSEVAGWIVRPGELHTLAVAWQTDSPLRLGSLGGRTSRAHALNRAGEVVGEAALASGDVHAFVFRGAMHDLGTLGGRTSGAFGISEGGAIVGHAATTDSTEHACLWQCGRAHDLGTLGGANSNAYGINAAGHIVGRSDLRSGAHTHAFLHAGSRMQDLNALLNDDDWDLHEAWAINDRGQIVGSGHLAGRECAYLLEPVPC